MSDWKLKPPFKAASQLNPIVLAYMGDAVYELFVRQHFIAALNQPVHKLHRQTTSFVSAKAQAKALQIWMPQLTEQEQDIVRRGRNAKSTNSSKNADVLEYRHSTALECLVGYLYYEGEWERLEQLMGLVLPDPERKEEL